ncbi:FAD/NAD(P)-binding domain-containing protein [Aspergillus taichungensis]|uniref:FAD/NAD(P)-binding domain-containing protein n=1 Tax=Aspergillus taichungensis TaxID=482145 RepID=A0A2J5I398_9EURO|nr:FAD/NAD(P)-binding domain-containing protein [Aspergillus taichungensis]
MQRPKKVAIIGGGPSGLVAAKTLLQNHPEGTFHPVIFEKRHDIGGLWPTEPPSAENGSPSYQPTWGLQVDPLMRTNLSKFSVAFSDLAWDAVFEGRDVPMFPQAWQVGRYLKRYSEKYLSPGVLRLGQRVVRAVRCAEATPSERWTVYWVSDESTGQDEDSQEETSETFDFLLVASGYFSSPHIPDITGLDIFAHKTVHSSALNNEVDMRNFLDNAGTTGGKIVVIGGSISGVEAASALSLHLSSLKHSLLSSQNRPQFELYHICSRPFWTVPNYIPHTSSSAAAQTHSTFLPVDLVFYDLARRPPGPVEYGYGPIGQEQATRLNYYFFSLFGEEHRRTGSVDVQLDDRKYHRKPPSWVAIEDDYAEYVRAGTINPVTGRVCAVKPSSLEEASIEVTLPNGETKFLDNVAAIVMATGFTPFTSISYLPEDVLTTLEYSPSDSFLSLVLDGKGTSHADVPDLGFVGFYRGPYWGAMEMQAKSLAEAWSRSDAENPIEIPHHEIETRSQERQVIRRLRSADPRLQRGQFPMGDYVGLMESFSRDLGICRTPLSIPEGEPGPVIPARYTDRKPNARCVEREKTEGDQDVRIVLESLEKTLSPNPDLPNMVAAAAVFRALHGTWRFSRGNPIGERKASGTVTFYPRYVSTPGYEKELLCEEVSETAVVTRRSVYRLKDPFLQPCSPHIQVWLEDANDGSPDSHHFSHGLNAMLPQRAGEETPTSGEVAVHATSTMGDSQSDIRTRYCYTFHFDGVSISSWKCTVDTESTGSVATSADKEFESTVYSRGDIASLCEYE